MQNEATAINSLQETKRSNRARERETHRSNVANERLTRSAQRETNRHNLVTESQGQQQINESIRSNLERERLSGEANAINSERNNIQREYNQGQLQLGYDNLANQQYIAETGRINAITQANRAAVQNQADLTNAQANISNAASNRQNALSNASQARTAQENTTISRLRAQSDQLLASIKGDYLNRIDLPAHSKRMQQIDSEIKLAESKIRSNNVNTVKTGVDVLNSVIKTLTSLLKK